MQFTGQNINQVIKIPVVGTTDNNVSCCQNSKNSTVTNPVCNCNSVTTQQQTQPVQTVQPAPQQYAYGYANQLPQAVYTAGQNVVSPQVQTQPQPQWQTTVQSQVPNQGTQLSGSSGVTIQIFNPSVQTPGAQAPTYNVNAPCYPAGYYTGSVDSNGKFNGGAGTSTGQITDKRNDELISQIKEILIKEDKKSEKRKIVQLTDDYIRNLENYLNSQEKPVRLSAAKEVYARLEEDDSRRDDKALTALINKMLQDPSEEIRLLALTALDARICLGDDYTVGVLQNIQKSNGGYGQDAIDATNLLLKISGKQVEKEFPVQEKNKKEKQEPPKSSLKAMNKG